MKAIIQNSILACLAFCLGTACTEEAGVETAINGKGYLEVYATIEEASTVQSRADNNTQNTDKFGVGMDNYFSYLSGSNTFVNGCQIGLFSANGTDGNYDESRLVNVPLTYTLPNGETYGSFVNEDIEISSMTNLGHTFAYYPYSAINDAFSQTGNPLTYDIDLYVDDSNNPYNDGNKNKVIDLLKASNNGTISGWRINYTFSHACSMLTIERGIGFNGKNWTDGDNEVLVKLKNGLQGYITRTTGNFTFDVEEDDSAPVIFPANYYTYTNDENEVIKIHSVILPPKAKVEYIKIMDDFGTWQYVRPEGNILQSLEAGNRYPVTVKLDGPSPTIYPHEITSWNDKTISIENKNAGIYDLDDLKGWIEAYNNNGSNLTDYGTVGDETPWIFHLYADIDCSELTEEYQYFVQTFTDRLEGHGHTLSNIKLTRLINSTSNNIGFIGDLADGGSINNLKIDGISISGGTGANDCTGTIAGTITNGSITECKITGIEIYSENGTVGSLAGKAIAGEVDKCLLEGNLRLGKDASIADGQKLFGEMETGFSLKEKNTSGVYVFKAVVDNAETGENSDSTDDDSGTNNGDGTTGGN
ncbi:fimbrillin family protein [Phocaeicola barnesiae]|uniref:fimbrillin family protein n=1 Tax=Phocaeicola barnesiae TaxID=376804 RepID=UPI000336110F|nr:hypothetical protein [Phocaeicola barnesiae]CDD33109.1 putative uncharacterized protein [Bacteroides sp. CAG:714]